MKQLRISLFLFVMIFIANTSFAQLGIKAGVSSYDLAGKKITGDNIEKSTYGLHFGAYYRLQLLGLYAEPGIIFNSENIQYKFGEGNLGNTIKDGKYKSVDIPLLLGFNMGVVSVHGGPVGHFSIDNSKDITNDFSDRFKESKFGYQVGGGIELGRARILVSYEGNFKSSDGTVDIGGVNVNSASRKSRIIASFAYDLF